MVGKRVREDGVAALVRQLMAQGTDPTEALQMMTQIAQDLGATSAMPAPFDRFRNRDTELLPIPLHPSVFTMRIDLVGARPAIWRRVAVRGDVDMAHLHDLLQAVMGWSASHLHRFFCTPDGLQGPYLLTDFDIDEGDEGTPESSVRLDQLVSGPGDTLDYEYDLGDGWHHRLRIEAARRATDDDPGMTCLGGRRACPPEDVGGVHSWNELVAALAVDPDPMHLSGDLTMYAEWLPPAIDPAAFSVEQANEAVMLAGLSPEELLALADSMGPVVPLSPALDGVLDSLPMQCVPAFSALVAQAQQAAGLLVDGTPDPDFDPPSTDDLDWALLPWQLMLDLAGSEGIRLTDAGWMAPEVCMQIDQASRIEGWYGRRNRESNSQELKVHRRLALDAGLLRKYKGRLLPTRAAKRITAVEDLAERREALLQQVAPSLARGQDQVDEHVRAITLLLVAATGKAPLGEVSRWLAELGWSTDGGLPRPHFQLHQLLLTLGIQTSTRSPEPASAGVRYLAALACFGRPGSS